MENITPRKRALGKKLIGLGILMFTLAIGVGILQQAGWFVISNNTILSVILPLIILLTVGIFFWGGYLLLKYPIIDREKSLHRNRLMSWVYGFIVTIAFTLTAIYDWKAYDRDPGIGGGTGYLAFIMVVTAPLIWVYFRKSNMVALDSANNMKPRDEREEVILNRATQAAFGWGIFITWLIIGILTLLPAPSRAAIVDVLLAGFFLQYSIRNFFAWRLGLK